MPHNRRPEWRIGLLVRLTPGRHDEPPSDSAGGTGRLVPGAREKDLGVHVTQGMLFFRHRTPTHAHKNLSLPYANAAAVAGRRGRRASG